MSRSKNSTRNIITGFIYKMFSILFPFIIRSIIIQKLGIEYLGLGSLFTSILQVLNLAELGFSSAIVFSMYKPIANNDNETICALLNLYKKVYRIIGITIMIIGLMILPFITNFINGSYPQNINIYILYFIYLFNTVITYFLFAYKSALIIAFQRMDYVNNVNCIMLIVKSVFQIMVICILKNYYIYVLAEIFTQIINNITIAIIAKKRFPQYTCKGKLPKEIKGDIKKRIYGLVIQKFCVVTRNSADSIFLSYFLGLNIVGIYNNYYLIMSSLAGVMAIMTEGMTASVGNSIASESSEKNYMDMMKFNFIYMWVSGWITICLLCLYQPFMQLWMGKDNIFPISCVVCFCIYFYTLKMGDMRSVYNSGAGLWYEGKYRALAETFLNIVLNFFLGKYFGVIGIILATEISLFLINFLYGSTITFKYYYKSKKLLVNFYKTHFVYLSSTIVIAGITFFICNFITGDGILDFIFKGFICLILPNIIYFVVYRKSKYFEVSKEFIINNLKAFKKKKSKNAQET